MVDKHGWKRGQVRRGDVADMGIGNLLYEVVDVLDLPDGTRKYEVKALEAHTDDDGNEWEVEETWYVMPEWPSRIVMKDPPPPEEELLLLSFAAAAAGLVDRG